MKTNLNGAALSRRTLLAGSALVVTVPTLDAFGAGVAVGASVSAATAAEPEPDAPLLRECLAYLDAWTDADRRADDLDAVWEALGVTAESKHPDVVEAWHRMDEATDRAGDHINRLTDAEATTIVGVFAKAVAVGRFHMCGGWEESDALHGLLELMGAVVRLVRPSAGPLVRQILAHPALADVLGGETA